MAREQHRQWGPDWDPIWGDLAPLMYRPRDPAQSEEADVPTELKARSEFAGSGIPKGAETPNGASAAVDPQDGLFDRVVEDADLEAALEERERKRQDKLIVQGKYNEAHEKASGLLEALELEDDSVVRCGRFRIKVKRTEGRSVAFETSPSRRVTISLLDQ